MITSVDKFLAAIAGGLAEALAAGFVPEQAKVWVVIVLGALTAAGVYAVPNLPKDLTAPGVNR